MNFDKLSFRRATLDDLPVIVELLADDPVGAEREQFSHPLPDAYVSAFRAIDADPNNELTVACVSGTVVGVLQLTFIPYLTHRGSWRGLIEGVRVDQDYRSQGVGRRLIGWAVESASRSSDAQAVYFSITFGESIIAETLVSSNPQVLFARSSL